MRATASTITSETANDQIEDLFKNPIDNVTVLIVGEQSTGRFPLKLIAIFNGPLNTPYENGLFEVGIVVPCTYPYLAPKTIFLTKIYHLNILFHTKGIISFEYRAADWNPFKHSIKHILIEIKNMLLSPNINLRYCINRPALLQYQDNYDKYVNTVKEWTKKYGRKSMQL